MRLSKPFVRYSVSALRHTCTMMEFGSFSNHHAHAAAQYNNDDFIPESKCGLYCATFVKDDERSDEFAKILDKTFKRILRTNWNPSQGGGQTRFCVYRIKDE